MPDVILAVVIAVLLVERSLHARVEARDRAKLVNALVARDGRDLAVIEKAEQPNRLRPAVDDERRPRLPEGLRG